MEKVLARARRYGEVGLVVYCDLDDFKRVSTLQWMLEEIGVAHHGQKITAHASLGAEPYGAHDNALDLIRRADMAMYYNKLRRHIGLMQSAAE